jgi:hypothetical protein
MKKYLFIILIFSIGQSQKIKVPANAFASGSSWYCYDGYKRVGMECEKIRVPANAFASGSSWHCNIGYKIQDGKCIEMSPEEKNLQLQRISLYSSHYNYDVSGYGAIGNIDAYKDSKYVEGYLVLDDGTEVYFDGEWIGKGLIEGYDENGDYYELEVD